jgi:hypothetical protein
MKNPIEQTTRSLEIIKVSQVFIIIKNELISSSLLFIFFQPFDKHNFAAQKITLLPILQIALKFHNKTDRKKILDIIIIHAKFTNPSLST